MHAYMHLHRSHSWIYIQSFHGASALNVVLMYGLHMHHNELTTTTGITRQNRLCCPLRILLAPSKDQVPHPARQIKKVGYIVLEQRGRVPHIAPYIHPNSTTKQPVLLPR